MESDVIIKSNLKEVEQATQQAIFKALNIVGGMAESDVKDKTPVDSSNLIQSITHQVNAEDKEVYIGTAVEYAPYVEYGTGIYSDKGGRLGGYWIYVKGEPYSGDKGHKSYSFEEASQIVARMRAKGLDAHMTQGRKPTHFMRDAINENIDKYQKVIATELKSNMEK